MCYAQTTNGSHLTTEKQHNRRLRWNYYDTYCFIMFSYESHVVSYAVVVSSTYFIFQHTYIIILYCVCVRLIDLFAYAYTLYIYGSIRTIRSTHCMFECSVHNIYIYTVEHVRSPLRIIASRGHRMIYRFACAAFNHSYRGVHTRSHYIIISYYAYTIM